MKPLEFRMMAKTPDNVAKLWAKFVEHKEEFPAGDGDHPEEFLKMVLLESTEIYEVGDFSGVVMATDIGENGGEVTASPHIFLWKKGACRWREIRRFLINYMDERGIYRMIAENPAPSIEARKLIEKMGFNRVGVIRKRRLRDGRILDINIYDFLLDDVKELRRAS